MEFIVSIDDATSSTSEITEENKKEKEFTAEMSSSSVSTSVPPPASSSSSSSSPPSSSSVSPNTKSSPLSKSVQSSSSSSTVTVTPKNSNILCILCQEHCQPSGSHTPFLLECNHILCGECLGKVSNTGDNDQHQLLRVTNLRCADCFGMSSLPLTKHYALIRTLLRKEKKSGEESTNKHDIACEVCESEPAVIDCSDCGVAMCEKCDDESHDENDGQMQSHIRELIDMNILCFEHFKGLQSYCHTCSSCVCPECLIGGKHSGHELSSNEDVLEEQAHLLNENVAATKLNLESASSMISEIEEVIGRDISDLPDETIVSKAYLSSKNDINKSFEQLHAALQARRQVLLEEVEDHFTKQHKKLRSQSKKLIAISKGCKESISIMEEKKRQLLPQFATEDDIIIPADDFKDIIARLEATGGTDVSSIGPVASSNRNLHMSLESEVAHMQGLVGNLGRASSKGDGVAVSKSASSSLWKARSNNQTADDFRLTEEPEPQLVESEPVKERQRDAKVMAEEKEIEARRKRKSKLHLGRQKSSIAFSELRVGQLIDCLDSSNRWAEAKILQIDRKSKQILVNYIYWGREWDEWVEDVSYGVAPIKTHTYYAGAPLEKGFRLEVLHDGVWREGFVMDIKGYKVKVYYEDYSNTTQTKWIDCRDDKLRQFGLYSVEANADLEEEGSAEIPTKKKSRSSDESSGKKKKRKIAK